MTSRIPIGTHTSAAVDPLVREVHATVGGWGMAGDRMYWRPELVLSATPDGGNTVNTHWGPAAVSTNGWEHVELDLSQYLGGDLTFAFRYDTLNGFGNPDADGWYVEDVVLTWAP